MKYISSKQIPLIRINKIQALFNKLKLQQVGEANLSIIDEALTHTSAKLSINHEKLEFLGDAVLRLAASEFIDRKFPDMQVGERSSLRSHLVSDKWLSKIGQKIGIKDYLIIGKEVNKDKTAQATLEAESTEALIGALYKYYEDIEPIHTWLTPYWEKTSFEILMDPYKHNCKSALQEWSQKKALGLPIYQCNEENKAHGDLNRFFCKVYLQRKEIGEGWGSSRKEAEKKAAEYALNQLAANKEFPIPS